MAVFEGVGLQDGIRYILGNLIGHEVAVAARHALLLHILAFVFFKSS